MFLFSCRWRSKGQSQRNQTYPHLRPNDIMILGLHMVVDLEMLMVDMEVVDLVVVVTDQVGLMGVELVIMEHMGEVNLVGMEVMVVVWGLTGESPPLDTQVVMEAILTEAMTWEVAMEALLSFMGDMVPELLLVAMVVAMIPTLAVPMEVVLLVEVPSMEVEGDIVAHLVVDTILMEDRKVVTGKISFEVINVVSVCTM